MVTIADVAWAPPSGFTLTYGNLRQVLDARGVRTVTREPGLLFRFRETPEVVEMHDHSDSDRPREIHFMVAGQKVCELGEDYVDFLAEFAGKPVSHADWRNRITLDNAVLPVVDDDLAALARHVLGAIAGEALYVPGWAVAEVTELAETVLARSVVHDSYETAVAAPRVRHVPAATMASAYVTATES